WCGVRAVVMTRDDSSGGWLPVGGGGLSQVSVCRVRGARPEGGARQGHYVVHGERLRDQKTTLECALRPGLVYNKVNPIFHHWSLGDCKFGLTFQSPAEADEFQKSLLAALGQAGEGDLLSASLPAPGSLTQDTAETPCPLTSHVDSDSSSSHSHQETPPATVAAPIVTVESASGFGPTTPPQRRRSSAQVSPVLLEILGSSDSGFQSDLWDSSEYIKGMLVLMEGGPSDCLIHHRVRAGIWYPKDLGVWIPPPLRKELAVGLDSWTPGRRAGWGLRSLSLGPRRIGAARCVHCRALFRRRADGRGGRCAEAPDPGRLLVRRLSCLWCAESLLYHCLSDAEGDFSDPCACVSLAVPCLCCYAPLRACHWVAARCGCAGCGGRHEEAAR
uniref:Sprouty related EVH1 domain containing 3 n=1 Tax=Loxodonta africana TaxID=9785 RepID=G3ULK7_LOXAF